MNFPVLVHLTSANFDFAKAQSNGQDIRFYDADGTTALSYQIESWNSAGQEAFIWVKVPQIDASSTTDSIWMQYGNSSASDGQSATVVWNNGYRAVWHMNEISGTTIADSTGNSWGGTPTSVTLNATGQVDGGDTYTGSSYTTLPSGYIVPTGSTTWTFESWIYLDAAVANYDRVFQQYNSGSTSFELYYHTGKIEVVPNTSGASAADPTAAVSLSSGQWHHLVWTRNGATDTLYLNGAASSTTVSGTNLGFAGNYIGARNTTQNLFNGRLDEMRISSVVRSANWIAAQYSSMNNTFVTFGSQQNIASGGSTATFTQSPAMAKAFTIPASGTIGLTAYLSGVTGSMPGSPAVTATLKKGTTYAAATTFATLSSPTYSAGAGTLTWSGSPAAATTVAIGEFIYLDITNNQSGVSFAVAYDSSTKPSAISLPTSTVITVDAFGIFDAPYPGGTQVSSVNNGQQAYIRATASDPFGAYDITSLDVTITNPSAGTATVNLTSTVASTSSSKTFEYPWTSGPGLGGYSITAKANEGTEGINATATTPLQVAQQDLGTPSITTFTDSAGNPVTSYTTSGPAYVQVIDGDKNTDPLTVQTITAAARSR
ncbi:MAG: DUF2341 domain-containing protein [Verrucomicrobia bacterium]|nr:DUF2341 domain-containing protein [Verrucomicrobiota bacterium]